MSTFYSYQCLNSDCGQKEGTMVDVRTNHTTPNPDLQCPLCREPMNYMRCEDADADGYLPARMPKWTEELLSQVLYRYSLPWHVEQDWTWEVIAANGTCIAKFQKPSQAEEMIRAAEALKADLDKGREELKAMGLIDDQED